jgi:diguanylate cyclase (GGDEF)-like protein
LQAGQAMAERIRVALAETGRIIDGHPVSATVSAGVTAANPADVTLEALLENADAALYRAKLNGRNRVECSDTDYASKTFPRLVRVA